MLQLNFIKQVATLPGNLEKPRKTWKKPGI